MNQKKVVANISLSFIAIVGVLPAVIYSASVLFGQNIGGFSDFIYLTSAPIVFTLLFVMGIYLCLVLENSKKILLLIPLLCMAVLPLISNSDRDHMPKGAIVAFNLATGCPKNWMLFSPALGRTIIGATIDTTDGDKDSLTKRKLLETGGAETHKLSVNQMPVHKHPFRYQEGSQKTIWYNTKNTGREIKLLADFHKKINTHSAGKGEPHNNMQPFVALYYCQKV